MFQTPEALNPDRHGHLRLAEAPDYRFAAGEVAAPVVSGEMWQIAREYIMVFPGSNAGLPLAILGTQAGVNAYLRDGTPPWWGRYVPAHLRRYPFVAAAKPGDEDKPLAGRSFTVMIDTSAPQLGTASGQPLFDEDGTPSRLLKDVQQVLANLQKDMEITQGLVTQLDEAGVLTDQALTITPAQGEPVGLKGFRVVDQQKLRHLPPETLRDLLANGAMDLAFAHIASLGNLRDGLLAKKASGAVGGQVAEPTLEELFGTDDNISFDQFN